MVDHLCVNKCKCKVTPLAPLDPLAVIEVEILAQKHRTQTISREPYDKKFKDVGHKK